MPTRDERRRAARAERLAAERAGAQRALRRRRMRRLGAVLAAATAVVVAAVAISTSAGKPASRSGPSPAQAAAVERLLAGIPQHGTELGSPNAPVTLVEFADLKCPICREFTSAALPTLIERYVRAGKVKLEFQAQHFVGEQVNPGDSLAAARFAEAAGRQNRLWNLAELFYANQRDENTRYVSDAYLRQLGAAVPGLAVDRALAEASSGAVTAELQRSADAFAAHGFTGTPSFLIGRTGGALRALNSNALTPSAFTAPIDQLLAR